jgi:transposase
MLYVGLDVHQSRSSLTILDENGQEVKFREIRGNWQKVIAWIEEIPQPFSICFEASCGYGYLYDQLSKKASHVVVGHPGQLRLIFLAKKKHDRIDSRKLAKLLYLDVVPTVHVPPAEVRAWRSLINFRQKMVNSSVMAKNQARALLRGLGISPPKGAKWLWTKAGQKWLDDQRLGAGLDIQKQLLIEQLIDLHRRMGTLEEELAKRSDHHPGVELLMTIPGIGIRTAEAFMAWVDNPVRFSRVQQIGSYVGVIPREDSSGGVQRLGHITKDGPPVLRKLLCEAAWQHIKLDPAGRAFYERVMNNDPDRKKIALVAVGHRLSRIMLAMLKTGEAYRGSKDSGAGREAPAPPGSSLPAPQPPPLSPPAPAPTGRRAVVNAA